MRLLADENIRRDVIGFLSAEGHDVKGIAPGTSDQALGSQARKERRTILTNDADFANTAEFPPRDYSGILIFRIHPPTFPRYQRALSSFFSARKPKQIKGKTFLVFENSFSEVK